MSVEFLTVRPDPDRMREFIRRHRHEYALLVRELPRLIKEGEKGRYAVVEGNSLTLWETYGDARQYAYEKQIIDQCVVQKIDPNLETVLTRILLETAGDSQVAGAMPSCPSSTAKLQTTDA